MVASLLKSTKSLYFIKTCQWAEFTIPALQSRQQGNIAFMNLFKFKELKRASARIQMLSFSFDL